MTVRVIFSRGGVADDPYRLNNFLLKDKGFPKRKSMFGAGWWSLSLGKFKDDSMPISRSHKRARIGTRHYKCVIFHWLKRVAEFLNLKFLNSRREKQAKIVPCWFYRWMVEKIMAKCGNEPLLYYSHYKQEISIIVRFCKASASATNMSLGSSLGWGSNSPATPLCSSIPRRGEEAMACSFSANVSSQRTWLDYLSLNWGWFLSSTGLAAKTNGIWPRQHLAISSWLTILQRKIRV